MRNAASAPAFESIDANGDGQISRDEMAAMRQARMATRGWGDGPGPGVGRGGQQGFGPQYGRGYGSQFGPGVGTGYGPGFGPGFGPGGGRPCWRSGL